MKKIKIGYITKYFYPLKGGAENYILNLALLAIRDGHEVHVFTTNRKGKEKLKVGITTFRGITIHRCRNWLNFRLYFFFAPSLLFEILKTDLDLIHVSGFGFLWNDIVLIIKKFFSRKTKFINTPHGPFMALSKARLFEKLLKSTYTFIQRFFLNWLYDFVLQDSTFQWQWIVKYGIAKNKIVHVPVGIPEEIVSKKIDEQQKMDFIKKYKLEKKYVISTLSRIDKYKGFHHVIEILPKILKKHKNLVYLIMGRDEGFLRELKSLAERKKVKSNVCFIENISESEKYVALFLSNIFIFPSQWEAFGIAMVEAMSMGNAIISTKTEGGRLLITEGVNGYLYEFGDTNGLFEILNYLLENKSIVENMKVENINKAKNYTWENIYYENYLPLINEIFFG